MSRKIIIQLCSKGCGREAIKQLKNGSWICSNSTNQCPAVLEKQKKACKESYDPSSKKAKPFNNTENSLCSFGCGKLAKYKYKSGNLCCEIDWHKCDGQSKEISKRMTEILNRPGVKEQILITRGDKPLTPQATQIESNAICEYGCNTKAKYRFKNGRLCCSDRVERCQQQRNDIKNRIIELWKDENFKEKCSGREMSEESKIKLSNSLKIAWADPTSTFNSAEYKQNQIEASKIRVENMTDEEREHRRKVMKNNWENPDCVIGSVEWRKHISDCSKNKTFKHTDEAKKRLSEVRKSLWDDPNSTYNSEEFRDKKRQETLSNWKTESYQNKMKDSTNALNKSMNKKEHILYFVLNELFPNQYEHVGNLQIWINGKNPDFICKEQKKIIEFFGNYWHGELITGMENSEHEHQRRIHFENEGYKTLILWESCLDDMDSLIEKLENFHIENI